MNEKRVDVMVVDLTGNGGGTEWSGQVAQAFASEPGSLAASEDYQATGSPFQVVGGEALLGTFCVHHGTGIRWAEWSHDAKLKDPDALTQWFVEMGVPLDFLRKHYETNHLLA